MTPQMREILHCLAKEYGWKFEEIATGVPNTDGIFSKTFKVRNKNQDLRPEGKIGLMTRAESTTLTFSHPGMTLVYDGESYEESCSFRNNDCTVAAFAGGTRGQVNLADPDSLSLIEPLFGRVEDEIEFFCKNSIHRHKIGQKTAKKRRRQIRGGRKNRRDR